HQLHAELLLAQGRSPEALEAAERAVAADPRLLAARIARAKALRGVGKAEASRGELADILRLDPKNGEAARLELELLLDVNDFEPASELAFKKICLVGNGFVRAINGLANGGNAAAAGELLARLLGAVPAGCSVDPEFLLGADRKVLDAAAPRLATLEPDRADVCLILAAHWDRGRLRERAKTLDEAAKATGRDDGNG
ncbi:MAG: hypothetical protein FD126_1764, partial [Elusimicrobia bacterium]